MKVPKERVAVLEAMHPIAEKAHRQEDEDNLQPKRAKLSGRGKDQLASQDVLGAKYQDWQNDHRSCWVGNIEIHNIRYDIPTGTALCETAYLYV